MSITVRALATWSRRRVAWRATCELLDLRLETIRRGLDASTDEAARTRPSAKAGCLEPAGCDERPEDRLGHAAALDHEA